MSRKSWIHHDTTGEFELDLAPLLAVMVKLVPVMLISSAFVQLMIVETELPQVVKEAVDRNDKPDPNLAHIRMDVDEKAGFTVVITKQGQDKEVKVPLKDGKFDFTGLHEQLVGVKKAYPDVFKMDLVPGPNVEYGVLIKAMDQARQAHDAGVTFPIFDAAKNAQTQTPFMFPEVVFANTLGSGS